MTYFRRIIYSISTKFNWISVGALVSMTIIICLNVILRQFSRPITGTEEAVGYLAAILISFALASTQIKKVHVYLDMIVSRFGKRVQTSILSIGCFISIVMFSLVTWQMIVYAHDLWEISDLSLVLKIPVFLLVFPVAVCFLLFCLVLLIDFVDLLKGEVKK